MTKRAQLILTIGMALFAIGAVLPSVLGDVRPTLGLDLQGGFSVVLQAKEVNGELPSEQAVEQAKEIIRERVDGLGVAEPDITRQGRTVIVQLPGVTDQEQAESAVGSTAKLEFRPVLSIQPNTTGIGAPTTTTPEGTTTTAPAGEGSTTTTVAGSETTTTAPAAEGEGDNEIQGIRGRSAAPGQFAPTTTTTTTEPPPTTTAPEVPTTEPTTDTTEVPTPEVPVVGAFTCGGRSSELPEPAVPLAEGQVQCLSDDGTAIYILGPVGFTGEALSSSQAILLNNEWVVQVEVKGSQQTAANALFNGCYSGDATCPPQAAGGTGQTNPGSVAIVLDGAVLSAPAVQAANLASDQFTISGDFSQSEAKDLELKLKYGALPVEFEQVALEQVSATLGSDSLRAGMIAGLIGVVALALYMLVYYRGFGVVVVVSLVVWGALMWGLVCFLSETQGLALTLAGITGIIVSVGTTVDTYVVVFERVKDHMREGRSVRSSIERGYQDGIKTVLTANGAAFIGAFLLWYLTVGPVRGFAYFLGLSVILDLVVAVLFTRPLILLLGRSERFATSKWFGAGRMAEQAEQVKVVPA